MNNKSAPRMSYWEYLQKKRPKKTLGEFCTSYNYSLTGSKETPECLLFGLDNTRNESGMKYQYGKIGELISYFIQPGGLIIFEWDATEIVSPRSLKLMPFIAGSIDVVVERNITLHGIDNPDNSLEDKLVHSESGIIPNRNKFSCVYTVVDKDLIPYLERELDKLGIDFSVIQVGPRRKL